MLALTLLAAADRLVPWHIFAVTGISGVANLLGGSARPAMLPRVVPRRLLINAVTTQTVSFQVAAIAAPIIFWQLFDRLGVTSSFAVAAGVALANATAPPASNGLRETRRWFRAPPSSR